MSADHAARASRKGSGGAGQARAQMRPLKVFADPARWFELGEFTNHVFDAHDVVLMRTDPPVDPNYLQDTIVLSMAQQQGALVVNNPQGLRDYNEKLAALLFPQCCPPTLVSRDAAALNRGARALLRTEGVLTGPDVEVTARDRENKAQALSLAVGERVRHQFDKYTAMGEQPCLLTSPLIRPYVRSIIERFRPQTVVMSQNEIHPKAKIRTLGQI